MQITDDMVEAARESYASHGHDGHLRTIAPPAEVVKAMLTAALSDKQAVEVKALHRLDIALCNFINAYGDPYDPPEEYEAETKRNIKELHDAYNAAHSAGVFKEHSALVDVPAVEPVAWRWKFDADGAWHYGDHRPGPFRFGDPEIIEPLYSSPPLSREGEDNAVEIPADLVERCAEILEWKRSGHLPGNALRGLGQQIADRLGGSLFIDNGLKQAELATTDEALKLVVSLAATRSGSASTSKGCAE